MELSVQVSGQGLPLVFLHGWGVNSGVWQPLAHELATQYQVITIDLPGFGYNHQQVPSPYSLETVAELITMTIKQPSVIVGWSLGGLIASQIALTAPEKVAGLVTVASTPFFVEQLGWPGIKPNVLAGFHQQLRQDAGKTISNFLKIQAMGSPHLRQDIKQLQQAVMAFPQPNSEVLDLSLTILEQADIRQSLANIHQPFLRLYGKLDSLVPNAVIEQVSALALESDCVVFDKASHAPFVSDLTGFARVLRYWLATHFDESFLARH